MDNNYGLADIAAVTRNANDGCWGGGNGAWWIIILFLFVFMGGGFNGFNRQGDAQLHHGLRVPPSAYRKYGAYHRK